MSETASHEQHASSSHVPAHPSVLGLVANFFALMILLAATIAIAEVDLGKGNFIASTLIAATKMTLIMLFFMNLRYSKPLSRLVACAGFFWLAIMFVLTFSDYLSRGWLPMGGS
ncbi:MAG TPA: cytochrome C oxidase subunit IV family protein [Pirellulales bacterium]|nr:cytochrome C oxidase subunit IV family protein [Pirellulales bacterium]